MPGGAGVGGPGTGTTGARVVPYAGGRTDTGRTEERLGHNHGPGPGGSVSHSLGWHGRPAGGTTGATRCPLRREGWE